MNQLSILCLISIVFMSSQTNHVVCSQSVPKREIGSYDRPSGWAKQSRSETLAVNGIVATSHPLASQAGLDVLRDGGNAFDAAIAASAMLGVVEPMSCGIGGDLFAICWDAKSKKLYGLNASGRSPINLSRDVFTEKELDEIPIEGPLSWSVPGCVSGWQAINARFGLRKLDTLLQPSIKTARDGFPVTEVIAGYWKSAEEKLSKYPESAATYLVDQTRAPREGEVFRNAQLADTYQLLAETDGDAFYRGEIAKKIIEFSDRNGGYFSNADFSRSPRRLGRTRVIRLPWLPSLGVATQRSRNRRTSDFECT